MLGLLAGAAGSIISGLLSSGGSSKAVGTQVNNYGKAIDLEQVAYKTVRDDFSPFRTAGLNALELLSKSLGIDTGAGFKESPGYQFAFKEGMRAVDASAANKGLIGSGARMKALQDRGQGIANQDYYTYKKFANDEYFNYLTQLGNLTRTGATATSAVGDAGLHTADMAAKFYGDIGTAKSENAKSQSNIWGDVWGTASTGPSGGFADSPLDRLFKLEW